MRGHSCFRHIPATEQNSTSSLCWHGLSALSPEQWLVLRCPSLPISASSSLLVPLKATPASLLLHRQPSTDPLSAGPLNVHFNMAPCLPHPVCRSLSRSCAPLPVWAVSFLLQDGQTDAPYKEKAEGILCMKNLGKAGGAAQWWTACLSSFWPWVPSPTKQK